jgi:hypothetical protein
MKVQLYRYFSQQTGVNLKGKKDYDKKFLSLFMISVVEKDCSKTSKNDANEQGIS